MGEGESLQGEREERNVELLIYTELTSIRDKLRVRQQLCLSTEPLPQHRVIASAQSYCLSTEPLPQHRVIASAQRHCLSTEPLPQHRAIASAQSHCLSTEALPQHRAIASAGVGAIGCSVQGSIQEFQLGGGGELRSLALTYSRRVCFALGGPGGRTLDTCCETDS